MLSSRLQRGRGNLVKYDFSYPEKVLYSLWISSPWHEQLNVCVVYNILVVSKFNLI